MYKVQVRLWENTTNGKTPKAQADAGMGEIKRQLIYKGQWHHCEVQLAHRFYPSSKTCSNCQTVNAKLKRETGLAMQLLRHQPRPKHQRSGQPA